MIISIHTGKPLVGGQSPHTTTRKPSFLHLARRQARLLRAHRSASTMANYLTALRSLERFLRSKGKEEAPLSRHIVEQYDQWLAEKGVSANTRSCYLRSLRALYRRTSGARKRSEVFSTVFTGNTPTRKRALPLAAIRRLQAADVSGNEGLQLARDVFLYSLFALGMPFADLALLRWRDLRGGNFVYHRRKTGVEVRVHIEPCMRKIAERWRGKCGDRVFPLLPDGVEGEAMQRAYRAALGRYNRRLRLLAARVGLHQVLSSYTARHTWATMAFAHGMDLPLISTAMGHRSAQTTMVYIAQREHARVARLNKKLLERICNCNFGHKKPSRKDGETSCKEVLEGG